jgi:large subunit ribosomal protein L18
MLSSSELRERRKQRQRYKISKVAREKLRLSVHRTNCHTYAQVVDVPAGRVLATASTQCEEAKNLKNGANIEAAVLVGRLIAQRAVKAGVKDVVFDRSGFMYHGRIKALADSARENGLVF